MRQERMVRVTAVPNSFQARVVAARLGSEGIIWELRGNVDGPYPVGVVEVFVPESDYDAAVELLLADDLEASFSDVDVVDGVDGVDLRAPRELWLVVGTIVVIAAFLLARLVAQT